MPANEYALPVAPRRASAVTAAVRRRSRRTILLKWLRRSHAWIGVWGASLGLLFGVTGILLNHRLVMKIPAGHSVESEARIALDAPPASPDALAQELTRRFGYGTQQARARIEPAREVVWSGVALRQPARWLITLDAPQRYARAEYWEGSRQVTLKLHDADMIATLKRLHMSAAHAPGWILLADAFAGGLVFLSVSGLLLWTRLSGPRLAALALAVGGLAAAALLALGA